MVVLIIYRYKLYGISQSIPHWVFAIHLYIQEEGILYLTGGSHHHPVVNGPSPPDDVLQWGLSPIRLEYRSFPPVPRKMAFGGMVADKTK